MERMGFYPPPTKIIPNQEQLGQLERRLQFHSSTTTQPKVLTREQIETYNRDGYLKGFSIFSTEEMVTQRRRFDEVLDAVLAAGGNSYSIISAHMKYGFVYDLLTHPRIVAYVKDILGDSIIGWGAHYFCKLPRDGKIVSWHQDASFWPLTPSKTVTVWLAIDDADTENACMRFVAGSHHLGHLTYRMSEDAEASVLNQTVDNVEQFGTVVYDELKAGEISLHSDLLLHGSLANQSDRRRCGLTLRYCATDVRSDPAFGWNREGVVISGGDPSGHWANPARPSN
jgi:non-haem Fe2+, alpha-ketoglutarate-dependent halogenase